MIAGGTASELQAYIESADYTVSGPRIWAAVVFDQIPGDGAPGQVRAQEIYQSPTCKCSALMGRRVRTATGITPFG